MYAYVFAYISETSEARTHVAEAAEEAHLRVVLPRQAAALPAFLQLDSFHERMQQIR